MLAARTPGFEVTATAVKPKLRISKEDKLSFAVTSSRDGYLHVLVLGPDGSLLQLFPNDKASDHRVQAGRRVSLPDDVKWSLKASEPTGPEHFLVVVSATPRDFGELYSGEVADFGMKVLRTGSAATAVAARWPVRTPVLLGAQAGCGGGPAECDAYGAAVFSVEITK